MNKPRAFLVYGRFNPPTLGHRVMINEMISFARENGGVPYIVTTHTRNLTKNPLAQNNKMTLLRQMYPGIKVLGTSKERPTPHSIVKLLENNHNNFTFVVGSNRFNGFTRMFSNPNYSHVDVVSGGNRNANSNNVNGISATKVREAARRGNKKLVRNYVNESITENQINKLIKIITGEINRLNNNNPRPKKKLRV